MTGEFRVGDWLVQPLRNQIVRGEEEARLEPKAMELLVYMAEHAGDVVTKEELIQNVWQGAFVTDEALTYCIWGIRKALSDDARSPRFIQTIPKRGYRLVVPVSKGDAEVLSASRRWPRATWLAVAGLALCVVVVGWLYFGGRSTPPPDPQVIPITSRSGLEFDPALSPDGKMIAYGWNPVEDQTTAQIFVQMVGGGEPVQLTDSLHEAACPAWSPDGQRIAFYQRSPAQAHSNPWGIFVAPALGGPPTRIGSRYPVILDRLFGLSWSPDGKFLALADQASPEENQSIYLLSIETGKKEKLTNPPKGFFDYEPAFSPDGKSLAFARSGGFTGEEIHIRSLASGSSLRLHVHEGGIWDLDWVADGSALVFTSALKTRNRIFRISTSGGDPFPVSFGEDALQLSVSRRGDRLAYARTQGRTDIWRVSGPGAKAAIAPVPLITSTRTDFLPQFSPDGSRIAFNSNRTGPLEVWVCDSEGESCSQLTNLGGAYLPRWSPDGEQITFQAENEGNADVYVGSVEGGFTRRLTEHELMDYAPSWSADAKWLYFTSTRGGDEQVWRVPAEGGDAVQVTENGGRYPRESADGRFLYYVKEVPAPRSIWRIPIDGGDESLVLSKGILPHRWDLWGQDVVYIEDLGKEGASIEFYDVTTQRTTRLARLRPGTGLSAGISVSQDGRWILFAESQGNWDLMLADNFR